MERIATDRLILRPVELTDAAAIASAADDFEVARWLARMPHPYGRSDAEEFLQANLENAGRVWIIEISDGLAGVIGTVGEFGYWLARPFWGKGFATEAGRAVLAACFADPARASLRAGYFLGNARSCRVLEKLGFRETGRSRQFCRALDAEADHVDMVLTRAEFAPQP
ncbi:GNAT family N-acetyltransferase [Thioclava atlantica]|uniref:GNAT family acetyltransferase n=1 Tax=Thioclava atlantica TaxID=1317124 RepID=A0A085TSN8_9RHOB|nr:GNAT family N-acetyltransferase [Thioclava atlantica]KFE33735.1 GNAT family acetyltransferase [Thioclava atlantica]